MNTLIHVGLHKCASSYLQEKIFPQMKARYLKLRNYSKHNEYFLNDIRNMQTFNKLAFAQSIDRMLGKQEPELPIIVSHEALSGTPNGDDSWDPCQIAKRMKSIYPGSRVLIIVRNQFDYMMSLYAYRVCVNGTVFRGIARFIEDIEMPITNKLQYDRLLSMYNKHFGAEKVLMLPMELLAYDSSDFIRRISNFAEIPFVDQAFNTSTDRINPSPRAMNEINICRFTNFIVHGADKSLRIFGASRVARKLRRRYQKYKAKFQCPFINRYLSTNKTLKIPETVTEKHRHIFATSNALLVKLTGLDLESYGYPLP